MMPRLQAEESLVEAQRHAVGSGALKRGVATDITRRWQRQAGGLRRRPQKATPEMLNALGIGVTFVPPPRKDV